MPVAEMNSDDPPLTLLGMKQANQTGEFLLKFLQENKLNFK